MATEDRGWLSYKNNQLILGGVLALFGTVGVFIYIKRQQNLYEQVSSAIDKPVDNVTSGIHGDYRDLYDGDFWNPKVYLARTDIQKPTIDRITASNYAKQLYDSIGVTDLTSNQASGVALLKKLSNRADLAMVADRFMSIYNRTLTDYFKSHYEGALTHRNYVQDIYDVVQSLPI